MTTRHYHVRLLDRSRAAVATAVVAEDRGRFAGQLDSSRTPAGVLALFDEFEEVVNGQMLSFLDEVQDRIAALDMRVAFDDGREFEVRDLQAYPADGRVSFAVASILDSARGGAVPPPSRPSIRGTSPNACRGSRAVPTRQARTRSLPKPRSHRFLTTVRLLPS